MFVNFTEVLQLYKLDKHQKQRSKKKKTKLNSKELQSYVFLVDLKGGERAKIFFDFTFFFFLSKNVYVSISVSDMNAFYRIDNWQRDCAALLSV